jgi:hypothetical protein
MVTSRMNTVQEPPNGHSSPSFFKSVISKLKPQHDSDAPAPAANVYPQDELRGAKEVGQRCQFTFSDGRQCRMQPSQLCTHHASKAERERGAKGAYDHALEAPPLEALCGDLTTATNINRALAQTFLLLAQGRISRRDAVAFGYLSQLLLQTVPAIRSEFVSAFGYRPWQENLTIRLGSSGSAAKGHQQDALSPLNKVHSELSPQPHAPAAPSEGDNARPISTPNESTSTNEQEVSPEPSHSGLAAAVRATSPDYASLLSRSSDLFDGKYDTTPEGRREANALVTELELLQPPSSKPPKGVRASAIEFVKRFRAQKSTATAPASRPQHNPAAAHPSPPRPPAAASAPPANRPAPPAPTNLPAPALAASASPPPKALAVSPERARSQRPGFPEACATPPVPNKQQPAALSPAPPVPGITLTRTGHTHDWHALASCSKPSQPDPFPSRRDKLRRELRSMSSCRLRRLQHLQQSKFLE